MFPLTKSKASLLVSTRSASLKSDLVMVTSVSSVPLVASLFSVLSKTRKGIQSPCTSSRARAFWDREFFRL